MRLLVTGGAGFIGSNVVRWVHGHADDGATVECYRANRWRWEALEAA